MLDTSTLLAKKLLLVTGKGGIGKSLISVALAQAAAAAGKRVLLVESAAEDRLAPLLGQEPVGHREVSVGPNLSLINLDASDTFREYVVKYLHQPKLFDKVFNHRVVRSFINTIPGFAEVIMLGRLFYTAELEPGPRYDLTIFDGWASGHFLSLMTTPDAVIQTSIGGPLVAETKRVREFLADPAKVGTVYVGVPEDLVVSECLDFLPMLHNKSPANLLSVIMNKVPESPMVIGESDPASSPARDYARRRYLHACQALSTLQTGLAAMHAQGINLPVWLLPDLGFVFEPLLPTFGSAFLDQGRSFEGQAEVHR